MTAQAPTGSAAPQGSEAAPQAIGHWLGDPLAATFGAVGPEAIAATLREPLHVVYEPASRAVGLASGGRIQSDEIGNGQPSLPVLASLPGLYPERLGSRTFQETHQARFNYVGGAMARGIASAELVIALGRVGALGMFGAAGLPPDAVEAAIDRISAALDPHALPWGSNLIHSPNEHGLEDAIVDLYLRRKVRRVSASAYMGLTPAVVRYSCTGLRRSPDGTIERRNHLFAKISREEVAQHFMSPPPRAILEGLVAGGGLSAQEAELAAQLPLAQDIIVESDSGGHTDNRPLNALFPAIQLLRERLTAEHGYSQTIRLGAAGSLGTPLGVAAAYSLGAAFVVVGSVHQACIESGVNAESRALLAQAGLADVMMTASADMFELGVKVQVLKRGTLMGVRGNQLYDIYSRYGSVEEIPADVRAGIEKNVFRMSLDEIWARTQTFFERTDPAQLEKAAINPRHKLALIFRWYLGNSSRWPMVGETDRRTDYQLWCGPAMGAFNSWVKGSFLEPPENRSVGQVALNLLEGAALATRAQQLRSYGVPVTDGVLHAPPTRFPI